MSLIYCCSKWKYFILTNFFSKKYKISKNRLTGSIIRYLQKEHSSLLENLEKLTREINYYLTAILEKIVGYFLFDFKSNLELL